MSVIKDVIGGADGGGPECPSIFPLACTVSPGPASFEEAFSLSFRFMNRKKESAAVSLLTRRHPTQLECQIQAEPSPVVPSSVSGDSYRPSGLIAGEERETANLHLGKILRLHIRRSQTDRREGRAGQDLHGPHGGQSGLVEAGFECSGYPPLHSPPAIHQDLREKAALRLRYLYPT